MSLRMRRDERSLELVGTGEVLVLKILVPVPPSLYTHRASAPGRPSRLLTTLIVSAGALIVMGFRFGKHRSH